MNSFFKDREVAEIVQLVNDFVDDSTWQLVDRMTEFMNQINNQNSWTIAYGRFSVCSVQPGAVVLVARCVCAKIGIRYLCIARGSWLCGKIAYVLYTHNHRAI